MVILKLLEGSNVVGGYELQEYKTFSNGFYIKVKVNIKNGTVLYVKEYSDQRERNYSYHWQKKNGAIIIRWDNSPYHRKVLTHPYHKHVKGKVHPSDEVTLKDILSFIEKQLK